MSVHVLILELTCLQHSITYLLAIGKLNIYQYKKLTSIKKSAMNGCDSSLEHIVLSNCTSLNAVVLSNPVSPQLLITRYKECRINCVCVCVCRAHTCNYL